MVGDAVKAAPFLLVLFASLVCTPVLAQDANPPTVTLKELQASPERFINKVVRLRGQINSCFAWGCGICDTEGARICAGFEFAADIAAAEDRSAVARAERYQERQYRFAEVTLEAKLDPQCLANFLQKDRLSDGTQLGLCTDSAPALTGAHVVTVHARKSGRAYEESQPSQDPILPPASDTARQAMLSAFQPLFSWSGGQQVAVYQASDRSGDADFGFGCVCRENDCDGKWPQSANAALDSPANPYFCVQMQKENGVWQVALGLE